MLWRKAWCLPFQVASLGRLQMTRLAGTLWSVDVSVLEIYNERAQSPARLASAISSLFRHDFLAVALAILVTFEVWPSLLCRWCLNSKVRDLLSPGAVTHVVSSDGLQSSRHAQRQCS